MQFAGPIRSAGGTGASVSVLIGDYIRKKMGYAAYDPTELEVKRMVQELYDYHDRITNLQYLPSEEEIEFLTRHLPIQIDGPASEKIEVWNFKDLPRIETNQIRNGVCLVLGEGIAQKAPKLWKQLSVWGKDFGLEHWNFLEQFLTLQKKIKAHGSEQQDKKKISPDYTFMKDMVAGRPVFTHPLREGGLRLRYGRSRTSGLSAACMHPASMFLLNQYVATGTQLKLERPGKAACITACDTIEGPIIKTKEGSVVRITTLQEAKQYADNVDELLFLGDILICYGDFFNRAHTLIPPGYCEEWWFAELLEQEKTSLALAEKTGLSKESLTQLFKDPLRWVPTAQEALILSEKCGIPLHPFYSFHWKALSSEQAEFLLLLFLKANIIKSKEEIEKIIFPYEEPAKRSLEIVGLPHQCINHETLVVEKENAVILSFLFSLEDKTKLHDLLIEVKKNEEPFFSLPQKQNTISLKDKSGIFIGARMGRPEKAKMRKLTGSPQVLFPVGEEGGRFRCFQSSLEAGKVTAEFPTYWCSSCQVEAIYPFCEVCEQPTQKKYFCTLCKKLLSEEECPQHGPAKPYRKKELDVGAYFSHSLQKLDMSVYPDLIKGVKGTSNREHIPEHIMKGILRAKHEVYVNKDGTTRYDMTQLPMTHFKPKEIRTSIEKLKELGYTHDIFDSPLEKSDQILELKPQDIVLPACGESPDAGADVVFFNVANFIDELLVKFYKQKPFYNCKTKEDIIGHLALALAPHTCAAITTRIIGFSQTQGFFAHPMIHAATRRDCDVDEACVTLLLDALLNFSRKFLPAHRGSTQDAPLVLTSGLKSSEVDDMVFDMDIAFSYPLAFYLACEQYKNPWEVKIEQIAHRLGTTQEYEKSGFTHDTTNINHTVNCAAYKTLPSMKEKLKGQMDLAKCIRAVDSTDVARLVIEKHFLKDTKGN